MSPRCLGARVDAIYLGFDIGFRESFLEDATRTLEIARESGVAVLEFGAIGVRLVVKRSARGGMTCLTASNRNWRLRVELQGRTWQVEIRARAELLCEADPDDVVADARILASQMGEIVGERLRRVDLAADFEGWDLQTVDPVGWVRHPRSKMTEHNRCAEPDAVRQYRDRSLARTGFVISPGNDVSCRVYDKTRELGWWHDASEQWRPWSDHDEKIQLEHDRWEEGGWDGRGPVTRIEFQLRGEVLKELCGRDPDRLRERDEWWAYLVGLPGTNKRAWLRLVVPGVASRLRRCPLDPRWAAVQKVVFSERATKRAVRIRRPGFAAMAQAWGCLLTALAKADALVIPAVSIEALKDGSEVELLLSSGLPERVLVGAWWDRQVEKARTVFVDAMCEGADPGKALEKVLWQQLAAAARAERRYRDETVQA